MNYDAIRQLDTYLLDVHSVLAMDEIIPKTDADLYILRHAGTPLALLLSSQYDAQHGR